MRTSGILLHITSLPGPDGIGSLGKEAYAFVDFLEKAGVGIWQVLPVGPTGYGESPYQSPSAFAGNPMMISLQKLIDDGLLTLKDEDRFVPTQQQYVEFTEVNITKKKALRLCFEQSADKYSEQIAAFAASHPWAEDYAFFMSLKEHFGQVALLAWPEKSLRMREPKALAEWRVKLDTEIRYHLFVQWLFFTQWAAFRAYANAHGVRILGDMPIYASADSSDVWTHPEVFQLDKDRVPLKVAGVPPDYFSATGQLWGNPLYDWEAQKKTHYSWWVDRMKAMRELYDIVRIDHFIGFANYYSIDYGAPNAIGGKWIIGPGADLFDELNKAVPGYPIVAEDLGSVNNRVLALMAKVGYPGMKVLSFAFDGDPENVHLPTNYKENSVVYTGTHDNDTVIGWLKSVEPKTLENSRSLLHYDTLRGGVQAFIRAIMESRANTAVVPMQDILALGPECRMNTPGTIGSNWNWRMLPGAASAALADDLLRLNRETGRTGK